MDVSNKTIVVILVLALGITLSGMAINLNRLGAFEGLDLFTSAAVDSSIGVSNLTITSTTSITNNYLEINFGSGRVNASCTVCSMGTFQGKNTACCLTFTNQTAGFLLENTGNVNISVGYTCAGSCTAATFVGSATNNAFFLWAVDSVANPGYAKVSEVGANDTAKSCVLAAPDGGYHFDGWKARATQTNETGSNATLNVATTGGWLCGNATSYPLGFGNTMDAGVIHVNVTIDQTQVGTGGHQNVTFTFNATSLG
ncbi:MAG: hypothetical protein AABW48_02440 [Nanoarchaeota archaeon]